MCRVEHVYSVLDGTNLSVQVSNLFLDAVEIIFRSDFFDILSDGYNEVCGLLLNAEKRVPLSLKRLEKLVGLSRCILHILFSLSPSDQSKSHEDCSSQRAVCHLTRSLVLSELSDKFLQRL